MSKKLLNRGSVLRCTASRTNGAVNIKAVSSMGLQHQMARRSITFSIVSLATWALVTGCMTSHSSATTVALWLFDEQAGLYPSCLIADAATNKCPLVLGRGGEVVAGKYGNALEPSEQAKIPLTLAARYTGFEQPPKLDRSRKLPPMDWGNADFCALMSRGEKHLRRRLALPARPEPD